MARPSSRSQQNGNRRRQQDRNNVTDALNEADGKVKRFINRVDVTIDRVDVT
jgi:hypothetical protein